MKKISTGADNGGTDMSHDPFQEREAEKYANPIPSREFIIEHLTKREKPANREELAVELNIEGEEQIEALRLQCLIQQQVLHDWRVFRLRVPGKDRVTCRFHRS